MVGAAAGVAVVAAVASPLLAIGGLAAAAVGGAVTSLGGSWLGSN